MTRFPVAVFLACTLGALASIPVAAAAAEETKPNRTINTTGESLVYVVPDEVVVAFGVETFNRNLDEAKSANAAASKSLLAAIKGAGVEAKHVQTDNLSVELNYRDGRPVNGIDGYIVRRAYSVTLKDPKKLEGLIDATLKAGANQLMGVDYRTTELRKHRDHARKMAIKAAREKAVDLAKELDCGVGAPVSISESYVGASYWGGRWGGNYNAMAQNSVQVADGGGGEGGETVPLGQIGIRAQVTVVFDLVPEGAAAAAAPAAAAADGPAPN